MKTVHPQLRDSLVQRLLSSESMLSTADLLNLIPFNRATVYTWCRQAKIPHYRMPDQSYVFDPVQIAGGLTERYCG